MTQNVKVSELECKNDALSAEVAREGIVLLKNDGALPLKDDRVALFGAGSRRTCKGGTGSGEVNNRHNVSVEEGLELCGAEITTKAWLDDCDEQFALAERERDAKIKKIGSSYSVFNFWALMEAVSLPFIFPSGRKITESDVSSSRTDTAVYILSRQAGEGMDRRAVRGEYYPSERELEDVAFLCAHYKHTVLVINVGACMDMTELLALNPGAVVFMGQAGQEGGYALAELLTGRCNFSGKLAATWAKRFEDLPCSDSFSYLDGNTDRELYKEGIYVGYRYFDTFGVSPLYAFGYGLSYTKFEISATAGIRRGRVTVEAEVRNVGPVAGKEVVQVYLSCPSKEIKREYQQLAAFKKTDEIAAGGSARVALEFELAQFAAYDEASSQFVLESGNYIIRAGNSSRNTAAIATVVVDKKYVVEQCRAIPSFSERVEEIEPPACGEYGIEGRRLDFDGDMETVTHVYGRPAEEAPGYVRALSDRELADICCGDPAMMRGGLTDVVGACGQTDKKVCAKLGIKPAVMADGPAGLRLTRHYAVEPGGKVKADGKLPKELVKAKRFFAVLDRLWSRRSRSAADVYQFCTAWPSATVQAQTFSPELVGRIGAAVAQEMKKYGVGIWLAPGMNIQRFPLCGRNYEYYSEDPVLTAEMASSLTLGVQSRGGCAVTIKHFCCNNQEDNRMKSSSCVNERALREIYLKAFRLVIAKSRPECVMSGYNKVNGRYVNSSFGLIADVLRGEFGFDGVVMTDWQSVAKGQAKAYEVLSVQNDLIMAGDKYQHDELFKGLREGRVERSALEMSASRILALARKLSDRFE